MKTKKERPAVRAAGPKKKYSQIKSCYGSKRWLSSDNSPRVLWRLPEDIFFGPMKPVTVRYVEINTKRALKFICKVAGERSANSPELSPEALKDFDIISTLLEINDSTSRRTKRRTSDAFEYLSKEEQELGIEYAKAVLEVVRDEFREDSDAETLPKLRYAVENFQSWLEWLTDAAVRIKLGIKRDAA